MKLTRFFEGGIYALKKQHTSGAKYVIAAVTGLYCIADCQLLNNKLEPMKGYEYPVPISAHNIKELIHIREYNA